MAVIATPLNAGHSGGDIVVIRLPPILPVPNKPYGFYGC